MVCGILVLSVILMLFTFSSGAGGTAGVTTGGAAIPAAILACNTAQVLIFDGMEIIKCLAFYV